MKKSVLLKIIILSLFIETITGFTMYRGLQRVILRDAVNEQKEEIQIENESLQSAASDFNSVDNLVRKNYDKEYQAMVNTIAYLIKNDIVSGKKSSEMIHMKTLTEADAVYVINGEEKILAGSNSETWLEKNPGSTYYIAKIDDTRTAVIEKDTYDIESLINKEAIEGESSIGAAGEEDIVIPNIFQNEKIGDQMVLLAIVIVLALIIMMLLSTYIILSVNASEDKSRLHSKLISKISIIGFTCVVGLTGVAFYLFTLFAISKQSVEVDAKVESILSDVDRASENSVAIQEFYNKFYLRKCNIVAYIYSNFPELQDREHMSQISRSLGITSTAIFNDEGVIVATDSPVTKFSLSLDPQSQSYEFIKLLNGAEYVVQEPMFDDATGDYCQYIGVALKNDEGIVNGIAQIRVEPENVAMVLRRTDLKSILSQTQLVKDGILFAIDPEDDTFWYHGSRRTIGKKALDHGIEKNQIKDEFRGFITLDEKRYFATSFMEEDKLVYVAIPYVNMTVVRDDISLWVFILFTGCMFIFVVTISIFGRRRSEFDERIDEATDDVNLFQNMSASKRFSGATVKFAEMNPEQQIKMLIRGVLTIIALAVIALILLRERLPISGTVVNYVINGNWERGFNIFSLTACFGAVSLTVAIISFARIILGRLSSALGPQSDTIIQLLKSLVKYVGALFVFFYSLSLFGVDTSTLLASAGILTVVIGLGANSLVSDVIAGLFIILEGEFKVGDIVTIDNYRGTVVEIGIRTTKIEDPSGNIKIINNKDVTGVINMTRRYSYTGINVSIEYGESLERVEAVLAKELPEVAKRVKEIKEGPYYKGVVSLGDSGVELKIIALCAEADRIQLERDLNREIKLIFDKHNINIPFPQVVVNKPLDFVEATSKERAQAKRFVDEQKSAPKDDSFDE